MELLDQWNISHSFIHFSMSVIELRSAVNGPPRGPVWSKPARTVVRSRPLLGQAHPSVGRICSDRTTPDTPTES